jgi:hypothetical protein
MPRPFFTASNRSSGIPAAVFEIDCPKKDALDPSPSGIKIQLFIIFSN